jgi:hypothetical protein
MSKYLKKISALVTIIILSTQSTVFAATNHISNKDLYKGTALQLIKEMKSNKIIEKSLPLYDTKNDESAVLFDLNGGYVIVDEATDEVSEFSLTKDNQYFKNSNKHYVYGGPTRFYEDNNGKLKNLETNKEENNVSEVEKGISDFKKNIQKNDANKKSQSLKSDTTSASGDLYGTIIGGQIPNLSYNPNGICGSCAVGNLLTFFSWNINKGFIPTQYQSSVVPPRNGSDFIESIVPYIEGQASVDPNYHSPGSGPNQLQKGLTGYLRDKVGYLGPVNLYDLRTDRIQSANQINSGLPFVLGLYETDGNPYGNHWVLGIGYVYMDGVKTLPLYYKVVNGWGQNDVYVSAGWTDYMVSI